MDKEFELMIQKLIHTGINLSTDSKREHVPEVDMNN